MVQFSSLKLNGFKSFADKTDVEISNGLNGVVGPNGCGKSNLVEALRWVMGEASAKRMRGDDMEDVIFAGTSSRSSKNRAEVVLTLENPLRDAPAPFTDLDTIQVSRLIERDKGSTYRVNGKAVRARDVQMLFADTVAGANSPAMVSQGRVTAMINSKPTERRKILEESAGVAGLYARRHEAELRLRAAENNILRVDDILAELEKRYEALKKQARQANRYKNLSQTIRDLEALALYIEYTRAQEQMKDKRAQFDQLESQIRETMVKVTQLNTAQTEAATTLPALRKADADMAAKLQTHIIAKQRAEDGLKQLEKDKSNAQAALAQIQDDITHEESTIEALRTSLKMREAELANIKDTDTQDNALKEKEAARDALKNTLRQKEKELETLVQEDAKRNAELNAQKSQLASIESQIAQKQTIIENANKALSDIADSALGSSSVHQSAINSAMKSLEKSRKEKETIDADLTERKAELEALEKDWHIDNTAKEKILAEIDLLENLLRAKDEQNYVSALEQIKPKKGYEIALAKAMGDTLLAALNDPEANQYWLSYRPENLPELSASLEPLSGKVKAPEALTIALSQIGVIADEAAEPQAILAMLKPGQMAVSRAGDVYRWDGYIITAKSQSATAKHLEQKNRLEQIIAERDVVSEKLTGLSAAIDAEKNTIEKQNNALQAINSSITECETIITENRAKIDEIREANAEQEQIRIRQEERKAQAEQELGALKEQHASLTEKLNTQHTGPNEALIGLRDETFKTRQELSALSKECDRIAYDIEIQKNRSDVLTRDISDFKTRIESSDTRAQTLKSRYSETTKQLEILDNKPANIQADLESSLSAISELEVERQNTKEKLAVAEKNFEEKNAALKNAESTLSQLKEERAGINAYLSNFEEKQTDLQNKIAEAGFANVQEILEAVDWPEQRDLPGLEDIQSKLEKHRRERENMGAVNLMAAQECEDAEKELSVIQGEKDDLLAAIAQLRTAIQKLNREARQRMATAFESVNEHFQSLFTQLFSGGKAHLELTESDDILEAGLEIFAQPPGKTLQNLTLLSGGEQTLASIALIFAMFLTNPAPICVLDEVDAPLDDANVDRFCSLIEDIARTTGTRFLIITHHRMTMARMDRLYGVTMAERGISQLVSVDLQQDMFEKFAAE